MTEAHLDVKANKVDIGYELGGVVGGRTVFTQDINRHGVGSSYSKTEHLGSLRSSEEKYTAINASGYHAGSSSSIEVGGTTVLGGSNDVNITKHGIEVSGETTFMGKTAHVNVDSRDIGRAIKHTGDAVVNGIAEGVNEGGEKVVEFASEVVESLGDTVHQISGAANKLGNEMQKVAGMINFGGVIKGAHQVTDAVGKVGHQVVKHAPEIIDGAAKVGGVALEVAGAVAKML